MARDIEEFLRRAAERRRQAAQQQSSAQRRPQQRRPAPPPRQALTEDDVVREQRKSLSGSQPLSMLDESVGGHVNRHLDTSDIAAHAAEVVDHSQHMTDEIEQTDERLEARLDQTFDHEVGQLGPDKSVTDELIRETETNAVALELLDLFANPKTVRQSIMVAEILKRPDFEDQ